VNNLAAIWYRSKVDVTGEEYERFYGHISNSKIPYKFKLHYHTDVPISIKSILYVPSTNTEKYTLYFLTFSIEWE
jgi:TNF receptor-associated protein 1